MTYSTFYTAIEKAKARALDSQSVNAFAQSCRRFRDDECGASMLDYAMTLGVAALGSSGVVSAMGGEMLGILDEVEYALCMQVQQFCFLH